MVKVFNFTFEKHNDKLNQHQKKLKKEFPHLTQQDVEDFLSFSTIEQYKPDETIIEANKIVPDSFYYVLNGLVRGYGYTEENEPINFYFIENKRYFIAQDRLLIGKDVTSNTGFDAVTNVTVLKMDYSKLLEKCSQNQAFFNFYHQGLKEILGTFSERIKLMIISDAYKRYEHLSITRPLIVNYAQKKHIAQFLGITPNSLSRILSSKSKS